MEKEMTSGVEVPVSANNKPEFHPTQILQTIQTTLQQRYDVSIPYCVNEFVCHNTTHLQSIGEQNTRSPEMLFYRQDGDNLDISLYIDSALLDEIDLNRFQKNWSGELFNDCCMLVEGVSHFLYLTWNAHHDRQLSLLDMELQAEVDKFIYATLDAETDHPDNLLDRLYQHISYRQELSPTLQRRYKIANELAHVYCQWLNDSFTLHIANRKLAAELARFYRLNGSAKQQHIRQLMH